MENDALADPYMREALQNEVGILKKLKGPHTMGLVDFLQTKSRTYIV